MRTNSHRNILLSLIGASAVLSSGCGGSMLQERVTEGVIEFALTFPEYDPNGLMAGML
ncbi:MAG: hypothetical protein JNM91_10500, partial [Flavobacteriales bacterium]|nr:hypothetical protein [Flavobacteriales bacterium]